MKRNIITLAVLALGLALTGCTDDYTDWAGRNSFNPEEPAGQMQLVITPAATTTYDYDALLSAPAAQARGEGEVPLPATPDEVLLPLASFASFTGAPAITAWEVTKVYLQGASSTVELPFVEQGGQLSVTLAALDAAAKAADFSQAPTEHTLSLSVEAKAVTEAGQHVLTKASEPIALGYTPTHAVPAVEEAYYLVGAPQGWDLAAASMPFTRQDDGTFVLELSDVMPGFEFKIAPQSAVDAVDWSKVLGSPDGMLEAQKGLAAFKVGDGADPGNIQSAVGDKVKIVFDPVNLTYAITDNAAPAELYLTGSNYDWGGTWLPMTAVYGHRGCFWRMLYLNAGEEFKFAPQQGWGGDFGADRMQLIDHAGAALSGTGNVVVGNAGWYLVYVDYLAQTIETFAPEVYLIGETAGAWSPEPENLFSVPTDADGAFVSPALKADNEVRLCVHPKEDVDWWQMEFIVIDGAIVYRGAGPDQPRVSGRTGQHVSLNLTAGTGAID